MANKNFRVRHGLDIGDSVSITDAGTATGITTLASVSNGNITLAPNGTGDVLLTADTVQVGDSNANATITTNGTGDLILNTNNGSSSGSITIADGANGNITLAPNGTGDIAFTLNNGANLTNSRNYVFGAIRNSTTDSIGDIWALNTTGTVQPFRGISIDNSADTTKLPGLVLRNYNNTNTNRARIIFERARGTAASPTAIQSGDFLGEIAVGGANGAGTWINDTITASPAFFGFTASENWSSNTNLGTNFALSLAPQATTISTGANLVACLAIRPESAVLKGDQFAVSRAKTAAFTATGCSTSGTTLTIGTVTSGTVAIGQVVQTSTTSFLNSTYIVANISGSGNGSTWTVSSTPGTQSSLTVTGQTGFVGAPSAANTLDALADLRLLSNIIKGSTGTTQITTSASGTTLTLSGDTVNLRTAAAATLVGNKINYNRVYGQWQYDATVTPAAANTPYAYPIAGVSGVTDMANIASVGSTSRIIPGALGQYKLQFSVQIDNADNGTDHTAYFWWRKNGVDVPASMGRVHVAKSADTIAGWDNMIDVTTITDYWELTYAVSDTNLTLPYYAATAFGPATASMFITLIPIGA